MRNHLTVHTHFHTWENQRGQAICLSHTASEWHSWDPNPGFWTLQHPSQAPWKPHRESTEWFKSGADLNLNFDSGAGLPWASYFASLNFSFLVYKLGLKNTAHRAVMRIKLENVC